MPSNSIQKTHYLTRVDPDSEPGWSAGIPGHPVLSPVSLPISMIDSGPGVETSATLNRLVWERAFALASTRVTRYSILLLQADCLS